MKTAKPADVGLDATRLGRLTSTLKDDIAKEKYDGAVFIVARGGKVAMHEAVGFAERESGRVFAGCSRSLALDRESLDRRRNESDTLSRKACVARTSLTWRFASSSPSGRG